MRRRFFVDRFEPASAVLHGDAADHLGRVLRAERGQLYELSDGHRVWLAKIERVALAKRGETRVEFSLIEPLPATAPRLQIDLLLSIVKFDRFEWCLEKATELGATSVAPLAAARSDKPLIAAAEKRRERWKRILLESAQQSRRLKPPALQHISTPETAFSHSSADFKVILSERREAPSLRLALDEVGRFGGRSFGSGKKATKSSGASASDGSGSVSVALAIGPEGGWTDEELAAARSAKFVEVSLGETILRTETAVIAAMAILGFALAD